MEIIKDKLIAEQMENSPALFAISLSEYELICKVSSVIDSITTNYMQITEQGKIFVASSSTVTAVSNALKSEGIKITEIVDLATEVIYSRNWYTILFIMDKDGQVNNEKVRVITNDGKDKLYPMNIANQSNIEEQNKALSELGNYKYIAPTEWDELKQVLYIFEEKEGESHSYYSVPNFNTIRQGKATNTLTKIRAMEGKKANIDPITGDATFTKGKFTLTIPNYTQLAGLKTSTYQFLDAITIALTETGTKSPTVIIPLSAYMEKRGLKDRKEAKNQVKADLEVLRQASITGEEKRGNNTNAYSFVNIADSGEVRRNGDIVFTFGTTFFSMLRNYPVMPYPVLLQRVNNKRNPHSYYLGKKICEHKNMNIIKSNADIISVTTLLECASTLPRYEDIKSTGEISRKIIEPFERDLNALEELISWEYCHKNGEPLSTEELDNFDYALFSTLNIRFNWKEYPPEVEARAKERRKEALAKKAPAKKRGRPKKTDSK